MGFLNNDSVTVDAILTKHGRRKLANGIGLGIAKAAFSDDGIDYTLWNSAHPSGSANYGDAISNLPQLEAVPDDGVMMRYRLLTLPRNTVYMPYIQTIADQPLSNSGASVTITPVSHNGTDASYQFLIPDRSAINISGGSTIDIGGGTQQYLAQVDIPNAHIRVGSSITITPKTTNVARSVSITVTGTNTGAVTSFDVNISPNTYVQQS